MDPRTIPEDIYHLLENTEGHEVSEDNVEWAGEAFKELLRARLQPRKEGDVIRFSSLGKQPRQLWYQAHRSGTPEKLQGKQLFKFLYGDAIEILLLFLTKETGHEVTDLQTEVEVDGVHGHTDAVIDGVPVDCKSASPFAYQKFADGSFVFDDPFGYVSQLSGYAHALGRTDRAGFLVADKVAGDICFAPLDQLTIEGNPPAPRIAELKKVLQQETPPPRCYSPTPEGKSGNMKLGVGCSYCPDKDECWADSNGGKGLRKYFYSRGPVWLTDVQRDPKVAESV